MLGVNKLALWSVCKADNSQLSFRLFFSDQQLFLKLNLFQKSPWEITLRLGGINYTKQFSFLNSLNSSRASEQQLNNVQAIPFLLPVFGRKRFPMCTLLARIQKWPTRILFKKEQQHPVEENGYSLLVNN